MGLVCQKKTIKRRKGRRGRRLLRSRKRKRERARSDQWQKTSILHNSFHLRAGNVYVIASEVVAEAQVSPLSHRFRPQLDNGINHPNLNAVLSIAAQFPCGCRAICALDRMRIFPLINFPATQKCLFPKDGRNEIDFHLIRLGVGYNPAYWQPNGNGNSFETPKNSLKGPKGVGAWIHFCEHRRMDIAAYHFPLIFLSQSQPKCSLRGKAGGGERIDEWRGERGRRSGRTRLIKKSFSSFLPLDGRMVHFKAGMREKSAFFASTRTTTDRSGPIHCSLLLLLPAPWILEPKGNMSPQWRTAMASRDPHPALLLL